MSKADRAEIKAMLRQAEASKRPQELRWFSGERPSWQWEEICWTEPWLARWLQLTQPLFESVQRRRYAGFFDTYDGRLDDAMRNQVREEEARLALFGDNKPTNLRAREALITPLRALRRLGMPKYICSMSNSSSQKLVACPGFGHSSHQSPTPGC